MIECTQQQFEQLLKQLRDDPDSGITGPFIHSAPRGNMHRGPFKEYAWMVGKDTALKKVWIADLGWKFFISDANGGRPCST